ncbi:MAG TPA: cyclic nucleotide-binding domain-containing protein [Thermoanaerobaculia bacterium]|nr:cyclic nucleotide-binding domain-containing protein [Thermoanaerobaculia bacterium]
MSNPVFKSTAAVPGAKKPPVYTAVEHSAGSYVFREGELGREMFIIQEGQVEITKRAAGEERQLAVLEKGDFFGEMALLEDLPRAGSARALVHVKLVQINGSTFDQMLRDNPEIAVRMMRKLSRRLRETDQQLRDLMDQTNRGFSDVPSLQAPRRGDAPERLVHETSGMEFPLSRGSETTIGRKDPVTGIYPDIDLTPVDSQRSISRRHAKIYRRGAKYFLGEEIGTMNSTSINGTRLDTGVPAELRPGDQVRCGVVALRFELP